MTEDYSDLSHINAMIARSRKVVKDSISFSRMSQDRLSASSSSRASKSPIHRRADSTHFYEDRSRTRELTDSLNASEFECRRLERLADDLQCRLAVYEEYEQIHLRSREEFQQLLEQLHLMKADNQELTNRELQLQARISELQRGKSGRELQSSEEAESLKRKLMRQVEDYRGLYEEQKRQVEQLKAEKADLQAKCELRESFSSEQLHQELGQARAEISALQSDYRSKFTKLQEELERSRRSTQDLSFRQLTGVDQETYESKIQQLEDKLKEQSDYNLTLKHQIKYLYERDTTQASPLKQRGGLSSIGTASMPKRKVCGSCRRGHRKSQG
jgi:chromosome segregation ATPase